MCGVYLLLVFCMSVWFKCESGEILDFYGRDLEMGELFTLVLTWRITWKDKTASKEFECLKFEG